MKMGLNTVTVQLGALSDNVAAIARGDRHLDGLVEQRLLGLERRMENQERIHQYKEPIPE